MGIDEHMKIGGQKHLLYVWSLEKFLSRLHDIRDLYQEGTDAKDGFQSVLQRLSAKRYLDPWRELTLADGRELAEGKAEIGSRSTGFADDMSVASVSSRHSTAPPGDASSPLAQQSTALQPKMRSDESAEAEVQQLPLPYRPAKVSEMHRFLLTAICQAPSDQIYLHR
eukprot:5778136-Amphidinium_carterae.1